MRPTVSLHYGTPRSPVPSASTPRTFHPPSYYAIAGGLSPRTPSYKEGGTHARHQQSDRPLGHQQYELPLEAGTRERCLRSTAHSEIPKLETQLLPTLRDTVDRMTSTPLRSAPTMSTATGEESLKQKRKSRSRRSPPGAPIVTGRAAARTDSILHHSQKYKSTSEPPLLPSTPRLKEPVKSTLKSAFRSPVAVTPSPNPNASAKSPSPSTTGTSLKSMKNLLSRKCSVTLKSPFNGNKSSPSMVQDASHTVVQEPASRTSSRKRSAPSNIPRLRYYNYDPARFEDSDLERQYEAELHGRRRLTVTNGGVSFSDSSSGASDANSQNDVYPASNEHYKTYRSDVYPIKSSSHWTGSTGLGLSMNQSKYSLSRTPRQDDICRATEKTLRFSLPASESEASRYSNESRLGQVADSAARYDVGSDYDEQYKQSRRRSAERRGSSGFIKKHSPKLSNQTHSHDGVDEDTQSNYGGSLIRRSRVIDSRRRSSSCEPSASGPDSESEDAIPIVSRRSYSGSRHRTPSPCSSLIFPDKLRDLIKNRQSCAESYSADFQDTKSSGSSAPVSGKSLQSNDQFGQKRSIKSTEYRGRAKDTSATRPGLHRHPTEAMAAVENYRSAAARERRAFDIPPSDSDEIFNRAAERQFSHPNVSPGGKQAWQEYSAKRTYDTEPEGSTGFAHGSDHMRSKGNQRLPPSAPRLSVISPTQSTSSTYSEASELTSWERQETTKCNIVEVMPKPRGVSLHKDDTSEATEQTETREGVMQEIFETEQELLRLFHICLRVFVLPLRIQNSKSWISGVPSNVAKLLDWFDDIVRLHEDIYQSLCLARDTMTPTTDRVSECLRCFVLNAEVYQPYLVRLSDVSEEITALANSHDNELGQFIVIQQGLPECEGWTFERLLMLPVNRLAAYQDLFARMLDRTPKSHQDYLSTYSLSRSADMVIRVMTEVKMREDAHKLLKSFSARVRGLPSSTELAIRERWLLHSGPLKLVTCDLESRFSNNGSSLGSNRDATRAKRISKMMDTITSVSSSTVFNKSDSVLSDSTESSFISNVPATSTPLKSCGSSWFSRFPLGKRSTSKGSKTATISVSAETTEKSLSPEPSPALQLISVHAFIFNDIMIFAQPSVPPGNVTHWVISKDLGVIRPLSIARIHTLEQGTVLSLESMTVDLEHLNDHTDFRLSSYRTVDMLLPSDSTEHNNWLLAFRRCCRTTLRRLTFPGIDHAEDTPSASDRTFNMHAAVSSLVASGLPIPRSPSGTLPKYNGLDSAITVDEREERGWWSLRYRQVSHEFQRQDSLLSDDDENSI